MENALCQQLRHLGRFSSPVGSYGFVIGPSVAIASGGIVLIHQGARFVGALLLVIGPVTLAVTILKFLVERDDQEHGFFVVLTDNEVKLRSIWSRHGVVKS